MAHRQRCTAQRKVGNKETHTTAEQCNTWLNLTDLHKQRLTECANGQLLVHFANGTHYPKEAYSHLCLKTDTMQNALWWSGAHILTTAKQLNNDTHSSYYSTDNILDCTDSNDITALKWAHNWSCCEAVDIVEHCVTLLKYARRRRRRGKQTPLKQNCGALSLSTLPQRGTICCGSTQTSTHHQRVVA